MLQLRNLIKEFAGTPLFSGITWHLRKGERVGLVGENGAGKSTLMRIIAGQVEATSGDVQLVRGGTVGYLPQDGIVTAGRSLFAEARAALADLQALEREIQELTLRLETLPAEEPGHDDILHRLGDLQEEFRLRGGYALEAAVGNVLSGLGFSSTDWERDCAEFSGGWQMRIALARLLLQRPKVLLLDEPTNHLDIEARNWLEEYLCSYPYAVILVSHDRFFLDTVCDRIAEVWNGTVTDYHCSYSRYLVERDERVNALREAKRRQDEEVAAMEDFIRRFRFNANKASLVQSRVKQLEKIERISLPPERKRIRFHFPAPPKSGRVVLELCGLTKAYGAKTVLNQVDLTVEKGERITLVGHNGAGKSTLMGVLAGKPFQSGDRLIGHNVVIDYFAQDQGAELNPANSVYQELFADAPYDMVPRLRDLLGAFLFSGDDVQKPVAVLSGGERNRLALAKMLLRPANLLLMDEPTNHLDLFSKEMLLDALRDFAGTVVFVSHDRHFIDGLATRVVEVEGGRLTSYLGNYEDYLAKKTSSPPLLPHATFAGYPSPSSAPADKEARVRQREQEKLRQRGARSRQKRLAELEEEIEAEEQRLAEVETRLADPLLASDYATLQQLGGEHASLSARIVELFGQWEQLQEEAAGD